jgi:tRNA A-37 threonylcarbamoyl transferase component Bud32
MKASMQLRFDRYQEVTGRLQWTSLLMLGLGTLGVLVGSFCGWIGLLMFFMTEGGVWERRAGVFLSVFTGLFPLAIGALLIHRGWARRKQLRALRDLGALARQTPAFTTDDVARVLDVGAGHAHRIVLDAQTSGVLVDVGAPTPPPAQFSIQPPNRSGVQTVADPLARTVGSAASGERFVGTVLHGTYRIEAQLGAGGMGMVFRARHLRTGRLYAIKTLLPDARFLPDARARFEREATAASAIGHPNIIGVHDFNETPDGTHYIVMDLLEGETLEQRLSRVGSLSWPDAQRVILEVGAGLAAAHERGLLHRDVKPANVFLARAGEVERAVLVDFGLVKPIEEAPVARITATGAAVGTPLYMSPEQARGEPIDARSDLYALGAVLFEMVTGAPPFLDRTLANVYARLLKEDAPPASSVADRAIPKELDAALARVLAKSRDARFSTVRELLGVLQSIEAEAAPKTARMPRTA